MQQESAAKKNIAQFFSKKERLFIFLCMICGFLFSFEYAITRPPSVAIFVSTFSSSYLPYAWLATIPLNFLVISLYDRLLGKKGCVFVFFCICVAISAVNTLSGFFIQKFPSLSFFQFIWKDIYILLMFKQLWSLIHTTIDSTRAKYLYGIIFSFGGFGAVIGGIAPSFFAVQVGSKNLFFFTFFVYLIIFFVYLEIYKRSRLAKESQPISSSEKSSNGFSLIFSSKYLLLVLLIVASMQFAISLIEYQFNLSMEKTISALDLRTQYVGRVVTLTQIFTTVFQLVGAFLVVHFFGLKKSHLLIPFYLLINSLYLLIAPGFFAMSYAFVAIKSLDYSIFAIIREMLYIPMSVEEKFRAKAVIDVFGYRSIKGVSSLFLLAIQSLGVASFSILINSLSIVIYLFWILSVSILFKNYHKSFQTTN